MKRVAQKGQQCQTWRQECWLTSHPSCPAQLRRGSWDIPWRAAPWGLAEHALEGGFAQILLLSFAALAIIMFYWCGCFLHIWECSSLLNRLLFFNRRPKIINENLTSLSTFFPNNRFVVLRNFCQLLHKTECYVCLSDFSVGFWFLFY